MISLMAHTDYARTPIRQNWDIGLKRPHSQMMAGDLSNKEINRAVPDFSMPGDEVSTSPSAVGEAGRLGLDVSKWPPTLQAQVRLVAVRLAAKERAIAMRRIESECTGRCRHQDRLSPGSLRSHQFAKRLTFR